MSNNTNARIKRHKDKSKLYTEENGISRNGQSKEVTC